MAAHFTARLDRWLSEARTTEAAQQRARERWLREVAAQEATMAGVLLDLAERGATVSVRTGAGRGHTGVITAIGADFVALRGRAGAEVLVANRAVRVVRTPPSVDPASGDRALATDLHLAEVLGLLAAERERVLIVAGNGEDAVTGQLVSVGEDVAVLRVDADGGASAYVPLAAVAEMTLA